MAPRTPKQVIDQAVRENRTGEIVLYCLACGVFVAGFVVLISALIERQALMGIAGAISEALFVPALYYARQTRKENVAIRLLEAPLTRADTAKEASDMLWNLYREVMIGTKSGKEEVGKPEHEFLSGAQR